MKKISNYSLFYLLLLVCWGTGSTGYSQTPQRIFQKKIPKTESVSIDRFNNFYISDSRGNIDQYDLNGTVLNRFSPPKQVKYTLLEAWNFIKIFAFSQDLQQATVLNRFLTPLPYIQFRDMDLGFISAATIANDNNIWLVDDSDLSLKKFDVLQQKVIINSPFNLQLSSKSININFIREYQNHLILTDKINGILMFDLMGNYLKTLPVFGVTYINFHNDELYYVKDNKVEFYNFYTLSERTIEIPGSNYNYVLATDNRLVLISPSQLEIFTY